MKLIWYAIYYSLRFLLLRIYGFLPFIYVRATFITIAHLIVFGRRAFAVSRKTGMPFLEALIWQYDVADRLNRLKMARLRRLGSELQKENEVMQRSIDNLIIIKQNRYIRN